MATDVQALEQQLAARRAKKLVKMEQNNAKERELVRRAAGKASLARMVLQEGRGRLTAGMAGVDLRPRNRLIGPDLRDLRGGVCAAVSLSLAGQLGQR